MTMPEEPYTMVTASIPLHYQHARLLFTQYQQFLGEDLCFQQFEEELNSLATMYAPPAGNLWLAYQGNEPIGCVAIRPKSQGVAEMKRLFVLPQAQGTGLGRQLALASLQFARQAGYQSLVLDTLERLKPALALYTSLGFTPIPAYYHNPLPGVVYLQKTLNTSS